MPLWRSLGACGQRLRVQAPRCFGNAGCASRPDALCGSWQSVHLIAEMQAPACKSSASREFTTPAPFANVAPAVAEWHCMQMPLIA